MSTFDPQLISTLADKLKREGVLTAKDSYIFDIRTQFPKLIDELELYFSSNGEDVKISTLGAYFKHNSVADSYGAFLENNDANISHADASKIFNDYNNSRK